MEDFVKFLLIAGVIIIGIVKEVKKNKAKNEKNKRPAPTMPPMPETDPNAVPIPEAWGKMFPSQDIFESAPLEKRSNKPTQKEATKHKAERKREPVSQFGTLGNITGVEGQRSTQATASQTINEEIPTSESEFTIHSTEEARRAIIWGEILQRKY